MKTRRSTSYPTRNEYPKAETGIYNRLFVIAKKTHLHNSVIHTVYSELKMNSNRKYPLIGIETKNINVNNDPTSKQSKPIIVA